MGAAKISERSKAVMAVFDFFFKKHGSALRHQNVPRRFFLFSVNSLSWIRSRAPRTDYTRASWSLGLRQYRSTAREGKRRCTAYFNNDINVPRSAKMQKV